MTNREKYLNKISNKDMADFIYNVYGKCNFCSYHYKKELCTKERCIEGITKWLESEAELTADEMFEELGYKKSFDGLTGEVEYENNFNSKIRFIPLANGLCQYRKMTHYSSDYITENEHKAITKKIEELKIEELKEEEE